MVFNNSILLGAAAAQGGGGGFYPEPITQSLKFNDDESQYLSWTPAAAGNRKTWTWSAWVKTTAKNTGQAALFSARNTDASANQFHIWLTDGQLDIESGGGFGRLRSSARFRDPSSWYHFVIVLDATNDTTSDKCRAYVNGVRVTDWEATTNFSNRDYFLNSANEHAIGKQATQSQYIDAYMSDIYFIDGQALAPENFGTYKEGVWVKKSGGYTGTFGTNGFYLPFKDDAVVEGFNTVTYSGNGLSSGQSISGLGLSPDLVWLKERTNTSAHILIDTVRGANNTLETNNTNAEFTPSSVGLASFDADGFTIGSNNGAYNSGSDNYVAWAWDAGENNAPTGHSSVTYTGNGGTQSIKGFGFSPDLVWVKERSSTSTHMLADSVRGAGKQLESSNTNAEITSSAGSRTLSSFDSDGFSVEVNNQTNENGQTYVAWGWDAGNGSPVSNTDGSITSTVKANPATGFSIGTFTKGSGTETFGHGLSSAPELLILKRRDSTGSWFSYSSVTGATKWIRLNGADAATTDSTFWNNTAPTSSVATISTAYNSGEQLVFYAWNSVAGYSSIGSYTGTGASGNTVTTGFRPGFVMVKRSNSTGNWVIWDASRRPQPEIIEGDYLSANLSDAEESPSGSNDIEFTDTGFTLQDSGIYSNSSGDTFIYMAFKGSYADYVSDVNTDGTIGSRVKANPAYGFSITSYVGTGVDGDTVGHGLSSAPELAIIKGRTGVGYPWAVYGYPTNSAFPADGSVLYLNDTAGMTESTGSELSLGASTISFVDSGANINGSGQDYICYAFHSVAGYSKISSYSGTGAAGNAVTGLGFEPAWLMIKRTDNAQNWRIYDNTRDTTNPRNILLFPDDNGVEATSSTYDIDFDADGFTLNGTNAASNGSGGTYIYMAFADTREAAFWKDASGNDNNWTPNNLDYRDVLPDSTTNNFAVLNPLSTTAGTYTEGNTQYVGASGWRRSNSTMAVSSGKWYWEYCILNDPYSVRATNSAYNAAGFGVSTAFNSTVEHALVTDALVYTDSGYYKNFSGSYTSGAANALTSTGDIIGFAVDLDANTFTIYKNNVSEASGSIGMTAGTEITPILLSHSGPYGKMQINLGQDSTFAGAKPMGAFTDDNSIGNFQYAPPAGYLALCTENLAEVTVGPNSAAKPIDQFETILYTGNGGTQHIGSGGVQHPIDVTTIDNSLRFNDGDSAYLSRTPASSPTSQYIGTISAWIKTDAKNQNYIFGKTSGTIFYLYFNASKQLVWQNGGTNTRITNQTFNNPSGWSHLVVAWDTTQATAADRQKIYVDGMEITSFATSNNFTQNTVVSWFDNDGNSRAIGSYTSGGYYDGYIAEVHAIDGQALDPTSFGQYGANGYWIPKAVTGLTYGTNGFALDFSDNSTATALGTDGSGNTNNWTPVNLGVSDQMLDSPTQNFTVWNPLDAGSNLTFSEGNLQISSSANPNNNTRATFSVSSGSWYWENTVTTGTPGSVFGIAGPSFSVTSNFSGDMYGYDSNGNKIINGSSSSYGSTYASGDIIGIAFDADNSEIEFFKNNISQGTITGIISDISWKPFAHVNGVTAITNFGADGTFAGNITAGGNADANGYGDFKYPVPTGFLALVNDNIPEERGINSPDLVWIKSRSVSSQHVLTDSVRGVSKQLFSSLTNAETTEVGKGVISFDYDGFTLGPELSVTGSTNNSGVTYASWNWKAGGTAVANTDGSITSQVSANVDTGFSIVSYTGTGANATVGHGLGVQPSMIIVKNRIDARNWSVWHKDLSSNDYYLRLDSTDAQASAGANYWNSTAPTSSVFSVGVEGDVNDPSDAMIAYCFADVEGFSKAGSYTGNSSTDGPFVYTGFRPAWVMFKSATSLENWSIVDSERNVYNVIDNRLYADSSAAESAGVALLDFTSNGFKLRATWGSINASGQTFIYLAFAENPFKYANAR